MTKSNITPPPELALQWINEYLNEHPEGVDVEVLVVNAAQWGADQELEACCEWLEDWVGNDSYAVPMRAARRPKPPSLKEQALHELAGVYNRDEIDDAVYDTIRRALEALPDD